ncbi:telomeric repeat-binding factor 2 isoform X2 [Hyla sarda]|uniref:telomeric repeat-binding factor 2 isoform X2 n=1 Tax=Hyla sarda TaxID=327740 RepID=UPI0024C3958B|nr:telomeric repeat-binding factor 2 isoform X2 [Hyla sarda]
MEGSCDSVLSGVEPVVNQWVLEYFFHLYVDAFKSCRNEDFVQIRDIVSILIQRRLKCGEQNSQVLRIMQLLSCIEEGGDLDCTFDEENNETPLESAIGILDAMNQEKAFPADLINTNKQMLKEAAVVACIQKQQFGRARSILKKHLTNGRSTRTLRAELMHIIQERDLKHPLIANFSLSTIKEKVYSMFKNQIQNIPTFLLTLAQKDPFYLNGESKEPCTPDKPLEKSMESVSPQDEASPSDLSSASQSKDVTSPAKEMGADISVTSEMGKQRCLTLHQLVMEPDSQQDSETEEEHKQEMESAIKPQQQKRRNASIRNLFNSPTTSKRRKTLIDNDFSENSSIHEEQDTWSDEDELFQSNRSLKSGNSAGTPGRKKKWTDKETKWINMGVKKYGEGKWSKILRSYPFKQRTAIMIKDRWRTMKKLSLA